jgi:hypothetical protein
MRFCATRRSVLLDQLNLLQLIVDRPSRYDFSNGADLKEIATAAANTESDLDLIASCASAAIDSPSGAKLPKDFAVANGKLFPSAIMPAILPVGKPRAPGEITVPNFVGLTVDVVLALALENGVPIRFRHADSEDDVFGADLQTLESEGHPENKIIVNVQQPSPGAILPRGSEVQLGTAPI